MDNSMPRPQFDPSISLGNLLTVVALIGALIGAYINIDTRITTIEGRTATLTLALTTAEARAREADADLRLGLRRIDDKLTMLLIQGYHGTPGGPPQRPTEK